MKISLNAYYQDLIAKQLQNDRYNTASEVVQAGLSLLEEQELKLTELRTRVEKTR